MNHTKRAGSKKSALSLAAVSLALAGTSYAQTEGSEQPQILPEVEITGSYIPFSADAPAVPVDVLRAADIQRSGVSGSVLDVVRKSVPQFTGNTNLGSDNGNISSGSTNGGSQVALRGRATLVLVDGRRVAFSPVVASNGYQFVNVNMFPLAAIDTIEILKDGASATYGSDAVSGVVNIKLKADYEGFEVGGRYAFSDNDGDYTERSYYAVAGGKAKNTAVTVSFEYLKTDPIYQQDRPFSRGLFRSPTFAGVVNDQVPNANGDIDYYFLNPSLNAPDGALSLTFAQAVAAGIYSGPYSPDQVAQFFDLAQYPTLVLENERMGATVAVKHEISDNATLFGSLIFSQTETFSQLNAQPVNSGVTSTTASSPFAQTATVRNRFVTFPRQYITEDTIIRGVVGLRGNVTDRIKYEVAGNFNYISADFVNNNLIDTVAYNAAVASGAYNPFARVQAPGVIESFVGKGYGSYASGLYSFDARLVGDLFELPGGMVKAAVGAEGRRETLKYDNDRNSRQALWLGSTPRQPFSSTLEVQGYFAEARIPVFSPDQKIPGLYTLELSAAVRHEVYDSTSDPTVPKYTLRWMPFDEQLALRASYAESFSAPTLYDLNGPVSVGFTPGTRLTRYDANGNVIVDTNGNPVVTGSRQYNSRGGSNAALDPSTSENWTAGFVYSPKAVKGLTIEADWYNMDESDLVNSISTSTILQSVERLGPASPYFNYLTVGTASGGELLFDNNQRVTAPGQITSRAPDSVWVTSQLTNVSGLQQTGLDVKVTYNFTTENWGSFEAASNLGWINSFKYKGLPSSSEYGYESQYTDTFGTLPRWSTYTYVDWMFKGFTTTLANRFTPRVYDVDSDYTVEHHSTFDVAVAYNFSELKMKALDGLTLRLGVNNVFNELTPFVPTEGDQSADANYYDPRGRLFYVEGSYKF